MADPSAKVVQFPDLNPKTRQQLLSGELGTQLDIYGDRMFSYFGGDLLDVGEWAARDLEAMLRRDGQACALEAVLTLPIRQASRAIEPGKDDSGEAEFVRSVLMEPSTSGGMKTPMQDVIGQLTSAQAFKKAFYELVHDVRETDGRIVLDKIAFRPAATCEQKRDARTGEPDGFRQSVWRFGQAPQPAQGKDDVPGWVSIPRIKSFVYVHGKHRAPLTGTSELDLCYTAYKTKTKLLFLWYSFLESQALPKVVVYGNDAREAAAKADDIASMRSSAAWSGSTGPRTARSNSKCSRPAAAGPSQFQDALTFLETWQTTSVLAGFMGLSSLASLGKGSLALSQDQSAFFLKSRQAVTAEMAEAITHDVIAPLVTLNFGPGASYPSFRFGALTDESGSELVSLFQTLAVAPSLQVPAGLLDIIAERLATHLNLPIAQVDQVIQEGARQREAQASAAAPPGVPPKVAAGIGKLAGGVGAATKIAQKAVADSTKAPLPEDMGQPFTTPPSSR